MCTNKKNNCNRICSANVGLNNETSAMNITIEVTDFEGMTE